MTIFGLTRFINSAEELWESNEISENEYIMLLNATFSRHSCMEVIFAAFRSSTFYRATRENKEQAKLSKGFIFHCIRDLISHGQLPVAAAAPGSKKNREESQVLLLKTRLRWLVGKNCCWFWQEDHNEFLLDSSENAPPGCQRVSLVAVGGSWGGSANMKARSIDHSVSVILAYYCYSSITVIPLLPTSTNTLALRPPL